MTPSARRSALQARRGGHVVGIGSDLLAAGGIWGQHPVIAVAMGERRDRSRERVAMDGGPAPQAKQASERPGLAAESPPRASEEMHQCI